MSTRTPGQKGIFDDWSPDPWDDPEELYDFETERLRTNRLWPRLVGMLAACVLLAGLLVAGGIGAWTLRQVNPPGAAGEKVNFTLNKEDTVDSVSRRMEAAGIITSAKVFRWYVRQKGGLVIQPGYFTVRPKDNMGNILRSLRTPPAATFDKVTFPEGFTVAQFAARLGKAIPRLTADRFGAAATDGQVRSVFQPPEVSSLEGLMFPDTYQVGGNEDEHKVLEKVVKQMERIGYAEHIDTAPTIDFSDRNGYSPYEILIIASIIEREAKFEEDRPKIAQVIYNRLAAGWKLELDATLFYNQPADTPFDQLKKLDTPYNTYLHEGLPPTPIANPGRAAIAAAMHPAPPPPQSECIRNTKNKCGYLFYVLKDKEGHHAFSTNIADFGKDLAAARDAGVIS